MTSLWLAMSTVSAILSRRGALGCEQIQHEARVREQVRAYDNPTLLRYPT